MVPNLLTKLPIPKTLPKDVQQAVNNLKKSKNKEDCLRKAFDLINKKFRGYPGIMVYLTIIKAFNTDINYLTLSLKNYCLS